MSLIHEKLTYEINGICFKAHGELGRFCREKQYCDKLEELFKERGLVYEREYDLQNMNDLSPSGNRVDFFVENCIILEIKAKKFVTKEDYIQMQRYLNAANIQLGMIINFRNTYLKPKRIINFNLK